MDVHFRITGPWYPALWFEAEAKLRQESGDYEQPTAMDRRAPCAVRLEGRIN